MRPDWHRYMIVIAAEQRLHRHRDSGAAVSAQRRQLEVRHRPHSRSACSTCSSVWFELRFGRKPLLLFGMLGFALFLLGVLAGLVALAVRIFWGVGFRPLLNLVEICVITGSVFLVGGLVGEMIAGQRAELRELRRQLAAAMPEAGRRRSLMPDTRYVTRIRAGARSRAVTHCRARSGAACSSCSRRS